MKVYVDSYAGNDTSQSITAPTWLPNIVVVARVGASVKVICLSNWGADKTRDMMGNPNSFAGGVTSLDANGFSVGADARVNASGSTYHYICIQTAAADCSLVSYPGNGTSQGVTGAGFLPDFVYVLNITGWVHPWFRTSDMTGTNSIQHNGALTTGAITSLDADGFSVGSNSGVNASGQTYYAICIKNAANVAKVLTYNGTSGADNRSISGVGFQPDFAFIKYGNTALVTRMRFLDEVGDHSLPVDTTTTYTDSIQAFEADGVQVGSSLNVGAGPHYGLFLQITADGEALTVNVSEAVAIAESVVPAVSDPQVTTPSEAIGVADTPSLSLESYVQPTEAVAVAESLQLELTLLPSTSEAISLTEEVTLSIVETGRIISVSELISVAEAVATEQESYIAVTEAVAVADMPTVTTGALAISVSEAITVTDSVQPELVALINVSDPISVAETVIAENPTALTAVSDAVSVAESIQADLRLEPNVSDAITLSEAVGATIPLELSISETITVSESLGNELLLLPKITDAVSVAENIGSILLILPNVSDSVAVAEALGATLGDLQISATDTVSLLESIAQEMVRLISTSEAIAISESVEGGIALNITVSSPITVTDTATARLQIEIAVSEAIAVSEVLSFLGILATVTVTVAEPGRARLALTQHGAVGVALPGAIGTGLTQFVAEDAGEPGSIKTTVGTG